MYGVMMQRKDGRDSRESLVLSQYIDYMHTIGKEYLVTVIRNASARIFYGIYAEILKNTVINHWNILSGVWKKRAMDFI
jgi:hypothetical protein